MSRGTSPTKAKGSMLQGGQERSSINSAIGGSKSSLLRLVRLTRSSSIVDLSRPRVLESGFVAGGWKFVMRRCPSYELAFWVLLLCSLACNSRQVPNGSQSLPPSAQQDKSSSSSAQPVNQTSKDEISYAKNPARFVQMPVTQAPFNLKNPKT